MIDRYCADFETTTFLNNETWVWAWALCDIDNNENITIGNNIESFIQHCCMIKNSKIYFHNLKFDGEFIIHWLLCNGYIHIKDKSDKETKTFTTLISDVGQFFSIEVYFYVNGNKVKKVTFLDSLKILNFSVDTIAKTFNLTISKLEIDYHKYRNKNHIITKNEKDYIINDVKIVATALNILFTKGLDKMTQASNALSDFKDIIGDYEFKHFFPKLDLSIDEYIRNSYKGGFTFVNPINQNRILGKGICLDVNSLYPYVMYEKLLPFGEPIYFEGKYKEDKIYNLYVQKMMCSFKLKKGKIPCIQLKNRPGFLPNEYLESSGTEIVTLTLTNVDLKLFFEKYDVFNIKFIDGYKFMSTNQLFKNYIDKWVEVKIEAGKNKNYGMRTIAKLMLNSLYGKFALNPEVGNKTPYIDNDIVKYNIEEKEFRDPIYIPIGAFITAYAREKTIRSSQIIKDYSLSKYGIDMYFYSDTDSIHTSLTKSEICDILEIDEYELGKWKIENEFTKAKFIRQKCYMEEINSNLEVTVSGMPKKCLTLENNNTYYKEFKTGKLKPFNFNTFKIGFKTGRKIKIQTCERRSKIN